MGNLKFEAYIEVLYTLWEVDSLRTLKVHHCLSMVTIGCPQQPLIQLVIMGNLKFEAYFYQSCCKQHCSLSGNILLASLMKSHKVSEFAGF